MINKSMLMVSDLKKKKKKKKKKDWDKSVLNGEEKFPKLLLWKK